MEDRRRPGGGEDLELGLGDARRAAAAPPGEGDAAPDAPPDATPDATRLPMICRFLEAQLPGAHASVLRLDRNATELRYAAAPSAP